MSHPRARLLAGLATLLALAGCARTPAPGPGTGAAEAARDFFEALVGRDWARAYSGLHPDSRARCDPARFAGLAGAYRRALGFEPDGVRLRSCQEQGERAIAHVVLTGRGGPRRRSFKDAVTLRRTPEGWRVVLPANFGRAS
jgi:hypothetical protein